MLVADAAKGVVGAVAGRRLAGDAGAYLAATAAIAGHIAPVWSRFRGGKGVATSAGACLAVFPAYFPIDAAVAAAGAAGTRNPETATRHLVAGVDAQRAGAGGAGAGRTCGDRDRRPACRLFAAAGSAMILAKFASSPTGGGAR